MDVEGYGRRSREGEQRNGVAEGEDEGVVRKPCHLGGCSRVGLTDAVGQRKEVMGRRLSEIKDRVE